MSEPGGGGHHVVSVSSSVENSELIQVKGLRHPKHEHCPSFQSWGVQRCVPQGWMLQSFLSVTL